MIARDRTLAAIQGGKPDRTPEVGTDILAVPIDRIADARRNKPDAVILAIVHSPLTRARIRNQNIFDQLESDPASGNDELDELVMASQIQINDAIHGGADGICYVIEGAYPSVSSPMQYGGFLLERDRALLSSANPAPANMVLIAGENEPYIDFVSDLPAAVFAWDACSGWTPTQVRDLRTGALAANSPDADILLTDRVLQDILGAQGATCL